VKCRCGMGSRTCPASCSRPGLVGSPAAPRFRRCSGSTCRSAEGRGRSPPRAAYHRRGRPLGRRPSSWRSVKCRCGRHSRTCPASCSRPGWEGSLQSQRFRRCSGSTCRSPEGRGRSPLRAVYHRRGRPLGRRPSS